MKCAGVGERRMRELPRDPGLGTRATAQDQGAPCCRLSARSVLIFPAKLIQGVAHNYMLYTSRHAADPFLCPGDMRVSLCAWEPGSSNSQDHAYSHLRVAPTLLGDALTAAALVSRRGRLLSLLTCCMGRSVDVTKVALVKEKNWSCCIGINNVPVRLHCNHMAKSMLYIECISLKLDLVVHEDYM